MWKIQLQQSWVISLEDLVGLDLTCSDHGKLASSKRGNYSRGQKFKRHPALNGFWFLTNGYLRLFIFHHGTKFGAQILIEGQIMAPKRNSRWYWSEIRNHLGQGVSKLLATTVALQVVLEQQLHFTSSLIKTGRAGIFLCRATYVERQLTFRTYLTP